jgi:hypothetical protein
MLTIISLPDNFTTLIGSNATDVLGALSPYITLVIGVLLAVLVVSVLIDALKHH